MLGEMTRALCYTYVGKYISFVFRTDIPLTMFVAELKKRASTLEILLKIMTIVGIRCEGSLQTFCYLQQYIFLSEKMKDRGQHIYSNGRMDPEKSKCP